MREGFRRLDNEVIQLVTASGRRERHVSWDEEATATHDISSLQRSYLEVDRPNLQAPRQLVDVALGLSILHETELRCVILNLTLRSMMMGTVSSKYVFLISTEPQRMGGVDVCSRNVEERAYGFVSMMKLIPVLVPMLP